MPSLNTGNAILSNAIAVDSSYNVGIGGAASGSFKLQVTGTSNLTGALTGTSATFTSGVTLATTSGVLAINTTGRPAGVGGGDNGKVWSKQATSGNYGIATIASATDSFTFIGHNGTNAILGTSYGSTGAYTDLVIATADATRIRISGSTGAATFSSSVAIGGAGMGLTGINMPNQNYLAWYASGGSDAQNVAIRGNGNNLELSSGGGLTMTMDANQRVGIGTSSQSSYYSKELVVSAISEGGITIASTNTTNENYLMFADGTSGADRYRGYINYNHSNNSLSFATDAETRARITSDGELLVGTTTATGYRFSVFGGSKYSAYISQSGGTAAFPALTIQHNATSGTIYLEQYYAGGTDVGRITSNGSTITFSGNALSDARHKENIKPIKNALDAVNSIDFVTFNYKENNKQKSAGVTAQQAKTVNGISDFVIDGTDEDSYKAFDYNALIGYLGKAIQELNQKVNEQQQTINSLINR